MKTLILTSLFISFYFFSKGQDFSRLNNISEDIIDAHVTAQMAAKNMVGVSIGVIKDGEIVYLKGYGHADQENNVPATPNTLYRLASISKTFTAVSALQLWEDGILDLEEDIRNDVPEYPVKPEGTITMEDLLSNESGIQHYNEVDDYNYTARDQYIRDHLFDYDPVAAIDVFKDQPILFTPGTDYNYTSFGFNLAAAVVERVGNEPFEEQIKNRIVDVADMPFFQPAFGGTKMKYGQATGYKTVDGAAVVAKGGATDYDDVSWKMGGGGFICSARDLTHFIKAMLDGDLMEAATLDTMASNHDPSNGSNYGYGISSTIRNGDTLLSHNGAQVWTRTQIYFSPENNSGVAVMTNNFDANPVTLTRLIYDDIPSFTIQGSAYFNPIPVNLEHPIIISPADGEINTGTSFKLKWEETPYAHKYVVEYADNPSFNNSVFDTVKTTELALNDLNPHTPYWWRVKAINEFVNGGMESVNANSRIFSTGQPTILEPLPFLEDFEDWSSMNYRENGHVKSGVGYRWSYEKENIAGRAKFGAWSRFNNGSIGGLALDVVKNAGMYCNNYAILTLDLSQYSGSNNLTLAFDYVVHGDEGHSNDRVWVRGSDSDDWLVIYNWHTNREANGVYKSVIDLDIDDLLNSNGQLASSTFQIRFGQDDNGYTANSTSNDGVTFDNIAVDGSPALPVEFISFEAEAQGGSVVKLNWQTATEIINAGFEIQHSQDGSSWDNIHFEEGRGTSYEVNSYSFIHNNPATGSNYYRLKQMDFNGAYDYSEVKTVNFGENLEIKIYPNPTTDRITISGNVDDLNFVRIVDSAGRTLNTLHENTYEINFSSYPPGMYVLYISKGEEVITERVVVK